jgi:putative sigma-54 modulation protein
MKHIITGRNIEITKGLENAVLNQMEKLDKYFNENVEAQVTLSVQQKRHIIEITIPFNGHILRAEVDGRDMYTLIDDAVAIIEKQVVRFKNKLRTKHRNADISYFTYDFMEENLDEENDIPIILDRRKRFAVKPMDAEEAVMQMELLGHTFFVYLDAHTEEINVVYKRKNGTYGLIDPIIQ